MKTYTPYRRNQTAYRIRQILIALFLVAFALSGQSVPTRATFNTTAHKQSWFSSANLHDHQAGKDCQPGAQRYTVHESDDNHVALIPPMPALPRLTAGKGSGVFNAIQPGELDSLMRLTLFLASEVSRPLGLENAAAFLRHYLDGTGQSLSLEPDGLLADMPDFQTQVNADARLFLEAVLLALRQDIHNTDTSQVFISQFGQSAWKSWNAPKPLIPDEMINTGVYKLDWYLALGRFAYAFSAVATVEPGATRIAHITLVLHIYDRYDWDSDGSTNLAGLVIPNEVMARLHRAGLAHDYVIVGHTAPLSIDATL